MNIEKVEIKPNQYVWVDKDVEATPDDIKKGKGRYYKNEDIMCKIIAASPELNLEGVPTYVEWLAEQSYPISEVWNYEQSLIRKLAFIRGYQTAEKELFTEGDVIKAVFLARKWEKMNIEQIIRRINL
jgi:hypothetical protein